MPKIKRNGNGKKPNFKLNRERARGGEGKANNHRTRNSSNVKEKNYLAWSAHTYNSFKLSPDHRKSSAKSSLFFFFFFKLFLTHNMFCHCYCNVRCFILAVVTLTRCCLIFLLCALLLFDFGSSPQSICCFRMFIRILFQYE